VGKERFEIVISGTLDTDPNSPNAEWKEYEWIGKPGNGINLWKMKLCLIYFFSVSRRPTIIAPYQPRIDWQVGDTIYNMNCSLCHLRFGSLQCKHPDATSGF